MAERIEQSKAVEMMNRLQAINAAILEKKAVLNPMFYGMPDLLFPQEYAAGTLNRVSGDVERVHAFPGESKDDYKDRQNDALLACVNEFLKVQRDGEIVEPEVIEEMLELIGDLFFGRVTKAILWACRGGGKSLAAAIIIWLLLVYRKKSIVNMAGTGEQAKRIYEYTKGFWDCVPGIKKGMLKDDPLMKETRLHGNTKLICCSGEQGVGEHLPVFIADEACTDKPQAETNILRAMQGTFDHEDHIVLMLSTFHHPVGLFQQYWDNAPELGFKRYKWSVYDIMSACTLGMEEATPEDPWAQKAYCLTKCPLSRLEDVRDDFGKITGKEWKGCCGRARTSSGWQSFKQVFVKFETNRGTRLFMVEHECERPRHEGQIYSPTLIELCVVDSFPLDTKARKVVGIDWGLNECFMVLIGEWVDGRERGLGVVATRWMSNKLTDEVIAQLRQWQEWYGDDIAIRGDHSHPYCNKELVKKGRFKVRTVKGDREKLGEDNVQRWLASGVFKILREHTRLITQLKNVRQDDDGKQIKENKAGEQGDHGPDAMKFGLFDFDYVRWLRKYRPDLFYGIPEDAHAAQD